MKHFLAVLVASMFLASAAYVGAAGKDDKAKTEKTEKVETTEKKGSKAQSAGKKTDDKAKAGATGEDKKSK